MNKQSYIAPTMEAMNIETIELMAASNGESSIFVSNETTNDDASMAGDRRGAWGSLWD